ncbi:MAG: hypothetical protein NC548_46330 [Lachnospiraceae bacterium]|nr:hypothetical protein [Lachnospiraceae bacterium]MCM1236981.1 hypothetical protein [Ruminococcus flavefaciens]
MEGNRNLLELLEIYMDLTEKQDAIIRDLGIIIKRQATEIRHLQNYENHVNSDESKAEQILEMYENEIKS